MKSRLSVENPGKVQILLEDLVGFVLGILLTRTSGPRATVPARSSGRSACSSSWPTRMGKIPGLMSPTASINVTLGCAITVWVYYHLMGYQGAGRRRLPEALRGDAWRAALASRRWCSSSRSSATLSRVLSLSLRLFGNIFGEEMVVLIIGSIVPFVAPLPMMVLGVVTGTLQAFIFVMLTIIYLAAAVHTEHEHEDAHGHDGHGHEAGAHAAA